MNNKPLKIDTSLMFDPVKIGEMAAELEEAGFDGAYSFEGQSDPFVGLTVAAMKTEKMDLMTSIAVAFARNPMSMAYLANDLQQLSKGRFILGLGTQVKAHVERRFNMPWSKPAARMRDMVLAIKAIWQSWDSGERLNYEGEFYQHSLMPPTFTPPAHEFGRPPIYIAGVGPVMTRVAAEVGEGYFVHPFHTARSLAELSMPAIEEGLQRGGKSRDDFTISAQLVTAVGRNEEELQTAIFSARSQIAFYASTPAYLPVLEVHGWEGLHEQLKAMSKQGQWLEMAELITDDMLEQFALIGSPEQVAAQAVARCAATVDRISPVIYQPNTALLRELLEAMQAAQGQSLS